MRERGAWDRLGLMLAAGLVTEIGRRLSELPPGGCWGSSMQFVLDVLASAEEPARKALQRLLFEHPSWKVTGGGAAFAEPGVLGADAAPVRAGYRRIVVVLSWPRVEDSPLVKGGGGPAPLGVTWSPEVLPEGFIDRDGIDAGWKGGPR